MRTALLVVAAVVACGGDVGHGFSTQPKQYHIQTDDGPERYFRYQTYSGQYRREKRLNDGSVVGTYGWVDATGLLRLYDYIADHQGYRVVRTKTLTVPESSRPSSNPVRDDSSSRGSSRGSSVSRERSPVRTESQKLRGLPLRASSNAAPQSSASSVSRGSLRSSVPESQKLRGLPLRASSNSATLSSASSVSRGRSSVPTETQKLRGLPLRVLSNSATTSSANPEKALSAAPEATLANALSAAPEATSENTASTTLETVSLDESPASSEVPTTPSSITIPSTSTVAVPTAVTTTSTRFRPLPARRRPLPARSRGSSSWKRPRRRGSVKWSRQPIASRSSNTQPIPAAPVNAPLSAPRQSLAGHGFGAKLPSGSSNNLSVRAGNSPRTPDLRGSATERYTNQATPTDKIQIQVGQSQPGQVQSTSLNAHTSEITGMATLTP